MRQGDAAEMRQPFLFVYMHMYVCVHIQTHTFTYIGILINTYDLKNNLMLILDFLFPTLSSVPRGLRGTWVCVVRGSARSSVPVLDGGAVGPPPNTRTSVSIL